jgi:hypothetical protein
MFGRMKKKIWLTQVRTVEGDHARQREWPNEGSNEPGEPDGGDARDVEVGR